MRVKDVQDIARRLGFYNVEVMEDPWLPYHPEAYAERTPSGYLLDYWTLVKTQLQ
jgi:hypothetical protein